MVLTRSRNGVTLVEALYGIAAVAIVIALLATFFGANFWAKSFGGTINVESREKVVNATWKESNLWILTRPPVPGDKPVTLTFQEYSNLGILQGKVVITEKFKEQKAEAEAEK
jgi:hypothetical protein